MGFAIFFFFLQDYVLYLMFFFNADVNIKNNFGGLDVLGVSNLLRFLPVIIHPLAYPYSRFLILAFVLRHLESRGCCECLCCEFHLAECCLKILISVVPSVMDYCRVYSSFILSHKFYISLSCC